TQQGSVGDQSVAAFGLFLFGICRPESIGANQSWQGGASEYGSGSPRCLTDRKQGTRADTRPSQTACDELWIIRYKTCVFPRQYLAQAHVHVFGFFYVLVSVARGFTPSQAKKDASMGRAILRSMIDLAP